MPGPPGRRRQRSSLQSQMARTIGTIRAVERGELLAAGVGDVELDVDALLHDDALRDRVGRTGGRQDSCRMISGCDSIAVGRDGLRVEGDGVRACPRSRVSRPAFGVTTPRARVGGATVREDRDVVAGVARGRRDEADAAVLVLVVVPGDEPRDPRPRLRRRRRSPRAGYSGQYFSVRNSASENGLSSETRGRLNDGTTPRRCSVASIVAPFIGPPLSECSTQPARSMSPASARMRSTSAAARSADSTSWTSQPRILRLHTSSTRYR